MRTGEIGNFRANEVDFETLSIKEDVIFSSLVVNFVDCLITFCGGLSFISCTIAWLALVPQQVEAFGFHVVMMYKT